ncbi:MAG TPA: ribosomal-processing cysteine protease Prp [Lachnospiraceae bacterium]|nr:ribosomal-processing cysteine protease Prp [Lachnospiraceae bacterium]
MIKVIVYQNHDGVFCGFRMKGHAGFAAYGSDIVCSAVSVLVINTMNSIEHFTDDRFKGAVHEKKDVVSFDIISRPVSADAALLLNSLVLGLNAIQSKYGNKYIQIRIKKKKGV